MAIVTKVRRISNPRRRNKSRRRMTAKQIRFFGTKRQRAALKAHRRRAATPKRIAKVNPRRRNRRTGRPRHNPAPLVLTLGAVNPKRRVAVAHRRKRKSNPSRRRRSAAAPRRRRRVLVASNPRRHYRRRRSNPRRHHRRRNPAVFSMSGGALTKAVIGGLVGVAVAKTLPGFLPSNISGSKPLHVVATAASAFLAQFVARKIGMSPAVSDAVLFGGLMQTCSDIITSFLPPAFNRLALGALVPGGFAIPENPITRGQIMAPAVPITKAAGVSGLSRAYPPSW